MALGVQRFLRAGLLIVAGAYLCLHWVHLRADFPEHSAWMDWAKYTDEGWYGDAAIRHFNQGQWYVAGDFNPAVALPVWPLFEAALFRVTGVGVVPARALSVAVFAMTLAGAYMLLWGMGSVRPRGEARRTAALAPAAGVLLLAVSPFCFVFTRLAILEPMLNLVMVVALLTASAIRPKRTGWRAFGQLAAVGLLLPVLVLTKTTGLFLVPAILWMVWAQLGYRAWTGLRATGVVVAVGLAGWGTYFALVLHLHLLADYRYLFSANGYTGITRSEAVQVVRDTFLDGRWIGSWIYTVSLVAVVVALIWWRRLLTTPLIPCLLLWAGCYFVFLAYHANLQPRYYMVEAVPLTLLIPAVLERLWMLAEEEEGGLSHWVLRSGVLLGLAVVGIAAIGEARTTLRFVMRPQYSFIEAAQRIGQIIRADRTHSDLVLSVSGSDLSLMTGLPSINDDFGTLDLGQRVALYQPGWYVSWNRVEDDKMDALAPAYHLERVAEFATMDDPDRDLLILYRIDRGALAERRQRVRRPLPKRLVTRLGQQPSERQLQH